ncbi:MAG: hypothetical protein J6C85_02620 [Alphaproteobacteria bacterium]|nr:hypothetical protein [Alphaproteobacteria bacterium]
MKKLFVLAAVLLFSACSTKYILMDEDDNPVREGHYTSEEEARSGMESNLSQANEYINSVSEISSNDVFVVGEGADFVTYQYKNVRVDEISPLASMYCADMTYGSSPYLREVSLYHNGFMRATFDCVNLAI